MRSGSSITLKPSNRAVWQRSLGMQRAAKHIWRTEIVLLSANGSAPMRDAADWKSKSYVWRWQERFMQAGYDGLLRDKQTLACSSTRPDIAERVVALTRTDRPSRRPLE